MNGRVEVKATEHENVDGSPALGRRLTRRRLFRTAAIATTAATIPGFLAACQSSASSGGGGQGNFPSHNKWKFVFVNHVTTNPFFVPTQYGIQDACALLGCDYQFTGSQNSVTSEMVNSMNPAINAKADGIAVCITAPPAFDEPVARALD